MTDRRVLFVAHSADRTGPPRAMLALLRWLSVNTGLRTEVALLRGDGELLREFEELGPVWQLDDDAGSEGPAAAEHRTRALRRRWAHLDGFDVIYVNTSWSARALRFLPRPRRSLIVHVHELGIGLCHTLPAEDRARMLEQADRFIVGCHAVGDLLRERCGVPPERIARHPYFLVDEVAPNREGATDLRRALGISESALVVGTVAVTDWRKAPDLLLEIAWALRDDQPARPVHFVWVGGPNPGAPDARPTADEVAAHGLEGRVHFVGHQTHLWDWYRLFDVFALPSREDAFPLACLEAAAVGVPTVCFDNGGIVELVGDDEAGRVVPYPRCGRFAEALGQLLDDADTRRSLGAAAQARVRAHHLVDQCVPPLAAEIEALAAPRG